MKKLLALFLSVSIMFSVAVLGFGTSAMALETSPEADFIAIDGVLEEYIGPGGEVVIPPVIDGVAVREIASRAFSGNKDVTEVYIAEGIEIIGYAAFEGCENLYKVELPYSLYQMGSAAFANCALEEITIPGGLDIVPYCALQKNALKKIVFSYGVKEIHTSSFTSNYICSVVFPESVELVCGFTFSFPKDKGRWEFTICNPNCEVGVLASDVKSNENHNWGNEISAIAYSAIDRTQTVTYICPEGSKVGKYIEDNFQKMLESTKGSNADISTQHQRVKYESKEWFEEFEGNQKDWGITKARAELTFEVADDGSGMVSKDEGNGSSNGANSSNKGNSNNKNNSTNKNNGESIIYENEGMNIGLVLGIFGGIFILIIAGVAVFAIFALKGGKKQQVVYMMGPDGKIVPVIPNGVAGEQPAEPEEEQSVADEQPEE